MLLAASSSAADGPAPSPTVLLPAALAAKHSGSQQVLSLRVLVHHFVESCSCQSAVTWNDSSRSADRNRSLDPVNLSDQHQADRAAPCLCVCRPLQTIQILQLSQKMCDFVMLLSLRLSARRRAEWRISLWLTEKRFSKMLQEGAGCRRWR